MLGNRFKSQVLILTGQIESGKELWVTGWVTTAVTNSTNQVECPHFCVSLHHPHPLVPVLSRDNKIIVCQLIMLHLH